MRTSRTLTAGLGAVAMCATGMTTASASAPPLTLQGRLVAATACTPGRLAVSTPLAVKIGQLFMVGTPATGVGSAVLGQMATYHVGNVFLAGRTTGGISQVAGVTSAIRSRATWANTHGVQPLISTDQEGGNVQVLRGSGFSSIPTALSQRSPSLYYSARTWGSQLKSAGVNMNLAPVADTVPSWLGRANPPIGYWYREYGNDSASVTTYSNAFAWGMRAAGVAPTVKHFPGLGLVRANTDTTANVHDTLMTRYGAYSSYLNPFRQAAKAGVPFTMMSSAYYDKIDPSRPAVFSRVVIGSVLRQQIGFKGVVMTDDIGAAAAMSPYSYATRAVNSIDAGVQLLLTGVPASVPSMYNAVLARARSDAGFGYKVNAAALAIYQAKAAYGLLPRTC